MRKRPLSVDTAGSNGTAAATGAREHGELVSPSARLVEDFYIVVVIGVATPVNLPAARAGIEAQLARYPRFRSIQVREHHAHCHVRPCTHSMPGSGS